MSQQITSGTFDVVDDDSFNLSSSINRSERLSQQQKCSNVSLFLSALDNKRVNSSASKQVAGTLSIVEEITAYRSLAQKEFNMIIHGDKNSNAVRRYRMAETTKCDFHFWSLRLNFGNQIDMN